MFVVVLGVLIGAAMGVLAQVSEVPVPFDRGVFRLIRAVSGSLFASMLAGAMLGTALAAKVVHAMGTVTVGAGCVVLRRGRHSRTVDRAAIAEAVLEGDRLSLRDQFGRDLITSTIDVDGRALAEAFRIHGYPWSEPG